MQRNLAEVANEIRVVNFFGGGGGGGGGVNFR